jgi:hypothetical protein
VTESSPSVQTCRLSVVRDVQRSVASRSRHNSTHQSAEPSNAHNLYNPPLSLVHLQTRGLIPRYMESCPAQTTPNLPIRSHSVKEPPRHKFFLVGIPRVSSVQAQNSTVSQFRIFTLAHGRPKLTQPVFIVNARGFFSLPCY